MVALKLHRYSRNTRTFAKIPQETQNKGKHGLNYLPQDTFHPIYIHYDYSHVPRKNFHGNFFAQFNKKNWQKEFAKL